MLQKLIMETSIMRLTKKYSVYFLFYSCVFFAQDTILGIPEIKNYKSFDYMGAAQNWGVDQDANGNIYFANNDGLVQFDGASWHRYTTANQTLIRSLKIDGSGKIFVGGYNEFGYFKANSKGKLVYNAISKLVNRKLIKNFDFIWKVHLIGDEAIFQSFSGAFMYKNNKLKFIKAPDRFQFSFTVNNKIFFQDVSNGILEYKNGKLVQLKGTTVLNKVEVWGIVPLSENKMLFITLDKGIYIYNGRTVISWNTAASAFVQKNSSLGGMLLENKFIVLNTVLDGIIICDFDGKILHHINQKGGLQNNTVLSSFVDNGNNLWLGLDNGIAYVNRNSPLIYIGYNSLSTVYATCIRGRFFYVATNQGLFYRTWNGTNQENNFTLVAGTTGQTWNIQEFDNMLLCSHNNGAFLISDGKVIKVVDKKGYYGFKRIPNHPEYLVGATYSGFTVFEKNKSAWNLKNSIKGFYSAVNSFEIDKEEIWLKEDNSIVRLHLDKDLKNVNLIKKYNKLSKSVNGIGSIQKLKNNIYFQTNNQFYTFSPEQDLFFKDQKMSNIFKDIPKIGYAQEDHFGNIWYFYNKFIGVLTKVSDEKYKNTTYPFSTLTGNLVNNFLSINTINSENVLIGLKEGLVLYNSKYKNVIQKKPKVFIRSFSFPGDTLLFGNGPDKMKNVKLPYASNQVKFSFSSPSYDKLQDLKYSYKLDGFDKQWSNWTISTIKEYTYLKEGNYKIKVKALNNNGVQSSEAFVEFSIAPPWYRHSLAYFVYLILFVISLFLIKRRIDAKIRKDRYNQTIKQRSIYLEKESKIRLEQYNLEKEIERLKREKLKTALLAKDKELVNNTMQVVKNNKTLSTIINKLNDFNVEALDEATKRQYTKLQKSISKELQTDKSWEELEKHIKNVHFDFLKRLKDKYPSITRGEMDLATFLLMNMSTKEISGIMNISLGGVDLARYRLRRRLKLDNKENLAGFLMSI